MGIYEGSPRPVPTYRQRPKGRGVVAGGETGVAGVGGPLAGADGAPTTGTVVHAGVG